MRPRALTWGEVPKQVVVVQAVPTQALWFGQPSAREINYQSNHFYLTTDSGKEVQLRKLLAAYVQEQDAENAARATEDNTDYVSPLPWNLLHWIRDATTARTVADYIYRQYSQIHLGGERRRKLEGLAKQITDLLAVMQPLWRQLNQLPKERAYVIVPIHVSQPRYLPGFLGLTQDLRTQRLAEFTHLTFIAPSELNVIDNNPSWPVYVTGVQPRYWWALRQLPASNNLHWLLHKELFHDVFCHGALRQFELERDALHRQLWPLTIYANPTDPTLAATELAADLNAASPALPAYRAPSLFNRIGTNIELSTDPAFNISPPLPKKPASKPRPKLLIQQNDEWTALTDEDQAAAREVGRIPSEAALAELDDAVLHISPAQRTPDDVDQAIRLQEAEDVEELVTAFVGDDAESAPFATGLFTEEINSSIRQLNARARRVIAPEERPVWVHRHSNEEWMLEKCLLADVRSGEHFLDEKQLRESLRRAATKTASATRSRELPFWKQALREFAYKHYRYNPERLYRHMVEGRFGDIKLHVAEATFLRTYLAWDNYCQPVESTTRVPGSWQNRNAIYQVIGSQSGQIDEMQLLHREERWRRTLSNQEEASLRQEYQKVRRELLAWWQQCTIHNSGQISQDTIKQSLVHHVSLHPDKFKVFYDTDHRKLPEFTEDIYEYFISILTAALLKK
ncbi:hypothetical protein SAMN00120144_2114 [Hymenobacter roseosalivarius DSM 11622]|uniref:Uncharacterized protein n=1 Tax=Hymenobacter roseosalivarius DSM 11622 TaxID=645990 RepID=A0A1W1VFT4_9BACT|nr:hypothetical protein [Hymenobacter roseosalivarius]SMB92195.1 hypothetical protein SAMN00120144_2114 [Hymenobacter roseosalivarius DSM 11622]